jgi:hypothetical protein
VDLEHTYAVSHIEITFAEAGNFRYRIDGSMDAKVWRPVVDQTQTTATAKVRDEALPVNSQRQFIRIAFTGVPAKAPLALAEVKVVGTEISR